MVSMIYLHYFTFNISWESDFSVSVHHLVVVVVELTCWLLDHCLALAWESHSFVLLIAHKWYVTISIRVPLSIHVIYFYHMAWVICNLSIITLERSRCCGHKSACSTHLPILHLLVLHNLELKLLLLLVHLHIKLAKIVGIDLQSLTPTHLLLLVQHAHIFIVTVEIFFA